MKHFFHTRAISFLLSLSLLVQMVPGQRLSVFAEETEAPQPEAETSVIGEVRDRREVDTKHFRLSDGSFLAVAYGTPVHYRDESGSWQDIDNTLVQDTKTGTYRLSRPDVQVAMPEDLSGGTLLQSSQGDAAVSMALLDTAQALRLTGQTLSAQTEALDLISGEGGTEAAPAALTYDRTSRLRIPEDAAEAALLAAEEDPAEAALTLDKLHSAWRYEEVFPDVDLQYSAYGNSIKEEILVKARKAAYRYDFLLTLEGLAAVLNTDGSVTLADKAGIARYQIPAPMVRDAGGAVSYDVAYTLQETTQGTLLTVTADENWINAEEREFPVSIDPTLGIENQVPYDHIHSNYVMRAAPNTATAGRIEILVGGNSPNDKFRLFLYFNGLPEIPDGCEIVQSYLKMAQVNYTYSGMGKFPVCVYEVTSNIPSTFASYRAWLESFTWNTQPAYNTGDLIDCQVVEAKPADHTWDLTRLVKKWYATNEKRTMIALTMMDESKLKAITNYATAHFQAYNANGGNGGPKLMVKYRSTTGIEPYYTYDTLEGGAAGTAYVAHATGQLKAAKTLLGYASTTNPFSLSLTYNSDYFTAEDCIPPTELGYAMNVGSGWSLSCLQKVCKGIGLTNYLQYHDGDGTVHYFKKNGDYYYDEDGLGLKIQSKGNDKFIMWDMQGNEWTFIDTLLSSMKDDDGNEILIDLTDNRISTIRQKNAGMEDTISLATFGYDEENANLLTSITDAAGNAYSFAYNTGNLESISRGTVVLARYAYSGKYLEKLLDVESRYCLDFDYNVEGKVSGYREIAGCAASGDWTASGTPGMQMLICYDSNKRATYQDAGLDRVMGNADDTETCYLFDEARRTVNAYTVDSAGNILGASNAVYNNLATSSKTNNKTHQTSSIGVAARQLLKNSGFEAAATDTSWTDNTVDTAKPRTGLQAWKGSLTGGSKTVSQTVTGLTAGEEYTFSGFVNTTEVTFPNDSAKIALSVTGAAGGTQTGKAVKYQTGDGTGAMEWVRLSVTFTAGSGSHTVSLQSTGCTGTVYADDFQLEQGGAPSRHNLVENGGMELVTTVDEETNIVAWTGSGGEAIADSSMGVANTGRSLKLLGDPEVDVCAYQDIPVNLLGSETYVLSGWAYTDALVDNKQKSSDPAKDKHKQCGIRAVVYYKADSKDTTAETENFYVPFEPQVREQWQFASVAVVPKQPKRLVTKIRVYCAFEKNANTCRYDNISLVREASQTMAYDAGGNLKSVTTSGLSVDESTYSNGNLIKTVTGGYGTFTYTYDTTHKHRLTSVTNGKIKQAMTYDSFGNVTGTTLAQAEGTGKSLQTSAEYDTDGNRLASVTDASGAAVTYAYGNADSIMNGQPTTVTAPNGMNTNTAYDKNGRVTETEVEKDLASLAGLQYTYSNGQMSVVTRRDGAAGTQSYNFTYDAFGNMLSAKVGNKTLATYTYGANNGPLLSQTYGNGDVLSFTYDDLGRMKTATYDDGTVLTYHYNGEGTLHSVVETKGSQTRTYLYQYDTLGRLLSCQRLDGNQSVIRTWQHFNQHNQVDKTAWQTGSGTYSETYEYDEDDGSLTKVSAEDGHVQTLTYDTLSRLTQRALTKDSNAILTESYTYRDIDDTKTTTQVQQKAIQGGSSGYTFAYEYDGSGNIEEETVTRNGTSTTTTYTYDDQNQLIRENNQAAGKTWVWTYDTVGNILSRKEYAYTTGTLGAVLDTVNYGYANTQWQDLVTNYDGSPITYDAIGNPLSDGRRTYTWQNGRQLASLTQNGTTVTYSYDGSGLRTGKTVTGGSTQNYTYVYNGDKLVEMKLSGATTKTLRFTYDTNGHPMTVTIGAVTYCYVTNLQGDVVAILNSTNNTPVVEYTYDAWGKLLSTTGTMASTLGQQNPLRYRGYVYDTETALYYVSSRYYDPKVGRFISADDVSLLGANGDLASINLFSYCGNNPVSRADSNGRFWNVVVGAVVGAAVSVITTAVQTYNEEGEVDVAKVFISGAVGAVGGGIAATGLSVFAQAGYTILAAAAGDVLTQMTDVISKGTKYDPLQTLQNTALAGGCSLLGSALGAITSYGNSAISAEFLEKGSKKAAQAILNNSIGKSSSKLAQQAQTFYKEGIKQQNIARGISSVTGTLLTWGVSTLYSA